MLASLHIHRHFSPTHEAVELYLIDRNILRTRRAAVLRAGHSRRRVYSSTDGMEIEITVLTHESFDGCALASKERALAATCRGRAVAGNLISCRLLPSAAQAHSMRDAVSPARLKAVRRPSPCALIQPSARHSLARFFPAHVITKWALYSSFTAGR